MSAHRHLAPDVLFALQRGELPADAHAEAMASVAACERCRRDLDAVGEIYEVGRDMHRAEYALAARRGRRRLEASIRAEIAGQRRAWQRPQVAALALFAMFSGAALAVGAVRLGTDLRTEPEGDRPEGPVTHRPAPERSTRTDDLAVAMTPPAAEPPVVVAAPDALPVTSEAMSGAPEEGGAALAGSNEPRADRARPQASVPDPVPGPSRVERPRVALSDGTPRPLEVAELAAEELDDAAPGDARWLDVGRLFALAGEREAAADALLNALEGERAAEAADLLERMVSEGTMDGGALYARLSASEESRSRAPAAKLACLLGLRHRGDRAAIDRCRVFFQTYPTHPDVRSLALAAGRTAEYRVGDYDLAIAEYSRAILVSQFAGIPGTEALFARARCRMKAGVHDEARADLRLYLDVQPEARWRQDVREVAEKIGVPLKD